MSYILDALRKAETERDLTRNSTIAAPRQYDIVARHGQARRLIYVAVVTACAMALTWWWASDDVTAEAVASAADDVDAEVIEQMHAGIADSSNTKTPQRMPSARSPVLAEPQPVALSTPTVDATKASSSMLIADDSPAPKTVDIAIRELPATVSRPETRHTTRSVEESMAEEKRQESTGSSLTSRVEDHSDEVVDMVSGEVKHGWPLPDLDTPASDFVPQIGTTEVDLSAHDDVMPDEPLPPLLRTLPYRFQSTLPKIVINAQAYADEAEARFVIINMKKYREGDRTEAGIEVEEIGRKDLVLSYQGQVFRLQR